MRKYFLLWFGPVDQLVTTETRNPKRLVARDHLLPHPNDAVNDTGLIDTERGNTRNSGNEILVSAIFSKREEEIVTLPGIPVGKQRQTAKHSLAKQC